MFNLLLVAFLGPKSSELGSIGLGMARPDQCPIKALARVATVCGDYSLNWLLTLLSGVLARSQIRQLICQALKEDKGRLGVHSGGGRGPPQRRVSLGLCFFPGAWCDMWAPFRREAVTVYEQPPAFPKERVPGRTTDASMGEQGGGGGGGGVFRDMIAMP
ncbi:hypothetical protein N7539_002802 [Penicillium diatomitis]|uniref:Uncharacterized protein n=1 Tax=Penicillium diatomitis TaxID=2819901 RepID=A0A9W9XFD4_9EURO|nr:uncharacterized protein N7539_002802 [Penicillium diatomitis]KAJ5491235.1 hypothetical protein N7539_002802 [Penicillium diatomitis]